MNTDVSRLKEITVLYCEDEEYLRDITNGILVSFTKKQFIAKDGQEGLKIFEENQDEIDLIITDVNMPNMTGLEMSKEIKAINPNIPIIVATAFSNSEYLLEAIELGIDKYVLKPVNIKKLLDTMSKSLLYHELRDLYMDQLTHLQNRNGLIKDIKKINNSILALIDIDKFSVLNDLYGEENGDKILIEFAAKLKKTFISHHNVYRVGSDRFVVLSNSESCTTKDLETECKKFIKDIDKNGLDIEETNIDLNLTIGIATSTDSHAFEYAQRVIQKARLNYSQIMIYDKELFDKREDIEQNMAWIKKLKTAVVDKRFQAFFQPIVDANTQEIYKYEALIRYIDENNKEIAPYVFLPIAKKAKLFPPIK